MELRRASMWILKCSVCFIHIQESEDFSSSTRSSLRSIFRVFSDMKVNPPAREKKAVHDIACY